MEFGIFMDVMQIFKEVDQISMKQSKIIPLLAILTTIFLNSIIYLLYISKPLLTDTKILFGVEAFFVLVDLTTSLLLSIATVLASDFLYRGKYISLLEILNRTIKSFKRALITGFYVALFGIGYFFLFLITLYPVAFVYVVIIILGPVWLSSAILYLFMVLALIFFTYLLVIWTLAFVLSVLEEKYGMEALKKAAEILKGMKLKGFVLIVLTILAAVLFEKMLNLVLAKQSIWVQVSFGFIIAVFVCFVWMIPLIAFTVLYHKCKKIHGEEVELHGSKYYAKIASMPLINENIP